MPNPNTRTEEENAILDDLILKSYRAPGNESYTQEDIVEMYNADNRITHKITQSAVSKRIKQLNQSNFSNGIWKYEIEDLQEYVYKRKKDNNIIFPNQYIFDTGNDSPKSDTGTDSKTFGRILLLEVNPIFIDEIKQRYARMLTRRYLYDITTFGCQLVFFILPEQVSRDAMSDNLFGNRFAKIPEARALTGANCKSDIFPDKKKMHDLLTIDEIKKVILMGTEAKKRSVKKRKTKKAQTQKEQTEKK